MTSTSQKMIPVSFKEAETAIYRVFHNSLDPFDIDIFAPHIEHRILLCRTESFQLTRRQYDALLQTLREMPGEDRFFLYATYRPSFCDNQPNAEFCCDWECSSDFSYEEYCSLKDGLGYCLYSKNGNWGIIPSDEHSAALGGTTEFIEAYKNHYPAWRHGIDNFIEYWQICEKDFKTDISWTSKYLEQFVQVKPNDADLIGLCD